MYRVMLIDDERWVRTSLKKVIEKTGLPFSVIKEASDGLEALDWLKSNEADLIMTDVKMPVMEGLRFVQEVRVRNRGQPIIVVSGYDDFQFVQQALRSGVFDYLLKPVELEDMRLCLNKWMSQHQPPLQGEVPKAPVTQHKLEQSPIEQVQAYIRTHLSGEITLTRAAALVHLNPSYLSQLFKQQLNRNFVDYIVEVRMEEAKRLLSATSLRISEVADRVGYSDVAYFSNTFKKWNGCTPSEYRKEPGRSTNGAAEA
ncbi:response regulator transcription factor [Paenibacillus sp. UNC451MF]|uniref:response regulator transcription factor n=1 Tax=Paenibacillus sp. UNC451MF TaxID=1449063 RepID=UPI00048C2432|nr:response regulator [Paenibacillus sp. UNC451MF]